MVPSLRTPRVLAIAAVPVAGVAAVLGLMLTGAAAPTILADPGPAVRWGLPLVTVASQLALAGTVGALLMAVGVLPARAVRQSKSRVDSGGSATRSSLDSVGRTGGATKPADDGVTNPAWSLALRAAAIAAAVWTLLSLGVFVLTYARISGQSVGGDKFGEQLWQFITDIDLGRGLFIVVLCAATTCVIAVAATTPVGAIWALVVAVFAVVPLALGGHSAGATNHETAVTSLGFHYLGAAVWVGGLATLVILGRRLLANPETALTSAVRRYSAIALWCFVFVGFSGVVNAYLRVGSFSNLASDYGAILIAKTVLLFVLGGFGWWYRGHCIPQLADSARARRAFWRLVGVELLVMGAASGLAAALASSAPPLSQDPPSLPSPARLLTGYELPPAPTPGLWLTLWRPDLLMLTAAVLLAGLYLAAVVKLRRRGDAWPLGRTIAWLVGCALLLWVSSSGPAVYGRILFSAHMIQHMVLAMVIPLFFVVGAPVTIALRTLTHRSDGSRGWREWLLIFLNTGWVKFFANPIVAAANFAGSMIVFYYTPVFEQALSTHVGHELMMVHFLLVGYLFANALIGIDPGPSRPPYPMRLLLLFATMAFHAFFGLALMSGTALLVPDWFGLMGRPWGASAIADQQEGGGIAWGIGEIPTLFLAIMVAIGWSKDDARKAKRRDRAADRDGDAELTEYNDMLADLAKRVR